MDAVHSARPFPMQAGKISEVREVGGGGTIPHWLAEMTYALWHRLISVCGKDGPIPSLSEIEAMAGFEPLFLLDVLAGGNGLGAAHRAMMRSVPFGALLVGRDPQARGGNSGSTYIDLIVSYHNAWPALESDPRPFPVEAGPVSDGTGVGGGTIPRWLAAVVHLRASLVARCRGEVPLSLDAVERAGGFPAIFVVDVLAGGDGAGVAHHLLVRRNAALTKRVLAGVPASIVFGRNRS